MEKGGGTEGQCWDLAEARAGGQGAGLEPRADVARLAPHAAHEEADHAQVGHGEEHPRQGSAAAHGFRAEGNLHAPRRPREKLKPKNIQQT